MRGGFDNIIAIIMRLLGFKRRPAITLEDPNEKYPLRLIDKEVSVNSCEMNLCVQYQYNQNFPLTLVLFLDY